MSKRLLSWSVGLLLALCAAANLDARTERSRRAESPTEQRMGADIKGKADDFERICVTKPRFEGAFGVRLVFVDFRDTESIDAAACMKRQTEGVTEYFKRYTQEVCWPVFGAAGPVYRAPKLLGYYTRHDALRNRIGWTDEAEGRARVAQLRREAFDFVRRGASGRAKPEAVTAMVCSWKRVPLEKLDRISELRSLYEKEVKQSKDEIAAQGVREYPDQLSFYDPASTIRWADPLWPNSSVLLSAQGDAGTMIHELGHVLGAPDTYHAPEINDGVPGTPVSVGGGPTAPLYARRRYCGLLGPEAYPMIRKDGTFVLSPRWSRFDGTNPLGLFIPTVHPNYLLHVEYEPGEPQSIAGGSENEVGRYSDKSSPNGGIYAYYVNVTKGDSYRGHPDLCYVYRPGDPWLHGIKSGVAVFREGSSFDGESDPRNILPNQLPTGVTLTFGPQTAEGAEVTIGLPKARLSGTALKQSLLPIISLEGIEEVLPTSFRARLDVHFRGEPLLVERGFCYGPAPRPTVRNGIWPLWGYGCDESRVLGLRPGSTVYVRAYAKSPLGIVYSPSEEKITLPKTVEEIPALFLDRIDPNADDIGLRYDRRYRNGTVIGTSGFTALLKLMAYLRSPLDDSKPDRKTAFSYDRLHPAPTANRYPPTLKDLRAARDAALVLAQSAGIMDDAFAPDFEKRAAKAFRFDSRPRKGQEPIVTLENSVSETLLSRIRASLEVSVPVLCVRSSQIVSSPVYALDSCLIDGYRLQEGMPEFHIVYPGGLDRLPQTGRKTGWHAPDVLVDRIQSARLLFFNRKTSPFSR